MQPSTNMRETCQWIRNRRLLSLILKVERVSASITRMGAVVLLCAYIRKKRLKKKKKKAITNAS